MENLSAQDVSDIEQDAAQLESHLQTLRSLSPGPGAVLANRQQTAQLLMEGGSETNLAVSQFLSDLVEAQDPNVFQKFGFISLTMGMFNSSNIYVTLINEVYGDYLNALDVAFNTLIIGEIVDSIWPPVEGLGANVQTGSEVYPEALGPGEDGVFIGPFPDLNQTSLPQPVHIIPINHDVGRGPSYQSNLLGNC